MNVVSKREGLCLLHKQAKLMKTAYRCFIVYPLQVGSGKYHLDNDIVQFIESNPKRLRVLIIVFTSIDHRRLHVVEGSASF